MQSQFTTTWVAWVRTTEQRNLFLTIHWFQIFGRQIQVIAQTSNRLPVLAGDLSVTQFSGLKSGVTAQWIDCNWDMTTFQVKLGQ